MARLAPVLTLLVFMSSTLPAQAPEPPIADTRLSVHTLVREDVFAGFLQNDLTRLGRAEKNIERLLASRPGDRAALIAWQGAAALTRAALAHEAKQPDQFQQHYARARERFDEAARLAPDLVGVFAITGGVQVSIADRLPPAEKAAGWEQAYTAYQQLWRLQSTVIDKLPLHMKGEVLAGLAQSAQRTGRDAELDVQIERILTGLPGSAYARRAQQWKDDPASRSQAKMTCQSCHAPGTLVARMAAVATAN